MMEIDAGPPARRYICLCPPRVVRLDTCPVTLDTVSDGRTMMVMYVIVVDYKSQEQTNL